MAEQAEHKKGSVLTRAFNAVKAMSPFSKACIATALVMNVLPNSAYRYIFDTYDHVTALKNAPLTDGEAALAQAVFGPDFDTSNISKSYRSDRDNCGKDHDSDTITLACVRKGSNIIRIVEPDSFVDDYSRDGSVSGSRTSTFMHEMTHIWQNRGNPATSCGSYSLPEEMIFNTRLTFDDYCSERQAQLVGVYAKWYLRPSLMAAMDESGEDMRFFVRIRAIVEAKFPRTIALRQHMQQRAQQFVSCNTKAKGDDAAYDRCNVRFYFNLRGQPLTTSAQQVTFTLPNGTVRYPAVEAIRRAQQEQQQAAPKPAATAAARPVS